MLNTKPRIYLVSGHAGFPKPVTGSYKRLQLSTAYLAYSY